MAQATLQVLVVDDEQPALAELAYLLERDPGLFDDPDSSARNTRWYFRFPGISILNLDASTVPGETSVSG